VSVISFSGMSPPVILASHYKCGSLLFMLIWSTPRVLDAVVPVRSVTLQQDWITN